MVFLTTSEEERLTTQGSHHDSLMTDFNLEKPVMLFPFPYYFYFINFPSHPYDIKLCLVICHCSKPDEESRAWGATKTQADNSIWGPLQITYVSEPIQLPSSNPAYRTMALSLDAFVFPFFLLFFLHIFFIPGTISVCVLEGLSD